MKKLILTSILACFFMIVHSQSDTLFTKKKQKILCKIVEITETDLKYKRSELPDGPVYVISKDAVYKYVLSNGYTEIVLPDELSIENEHGSIIKNRSAIKISPFSPVNNQITVAYEKVIRVGMNLDFELGYSNSNINSNQELSGWSMGNAFNYGFYVKPGVKFFLGQDYSVKGLKYAHPLKGRYIRLELAASYLNYQDVTTYVPTPISPGSGYNYNYFPVKTDVNSIAYGGFVNYGRQFILGNMITLEYYLGVGFTAQSNSYTNKSYTNSLSTLYYYGNDADNITNYHGFMRTPSLGLSGTIGFRIGYILPDKASNERPIKN